MASPRSATRSNRLIGGIVVVILATAGVAAFIQETDSPTLQETTTTTIALRPPADLSGRRPAEVSYSWFNHAFAVEQIDFDMSTLRCQFVAETITPDLCAVARSNAGSMMLVGTEGFWDPSEVNELGLAVIPLDLTLFVLRTDEEGTRAISVLDGFTSSAYADLDISIDLYTTNISGDDVFVLHRHLTNSDADPFDFSESVQVIAMSPTGAPTLVASYEGYQLRVGATESSLELSSLRYRSSTSSNTDPFFTRVTLVPPSGTSDTFLWDELVTSSKYEVPQGHSMNLEASYAFASMSQDDSQF